MNIWLYKGTHHFVQCEHILEKAWKFENPSEENFYDYIVNGNWALNGRTFNVPHRTLCNTATNYYPLKRSEQNHDNVKFYIRPLECRLKKEMGAKFLDIG